MFYGYYFSTVFGWIWNTPKKDDEGNELHTSDIPISSEEADKSDTIDAKSSEEEEKSKEETLALNEAIVASINDPPASKPVASLPIQVVGKRKPQKYYKHHIR